jgi:hypothetical protein
VLNQEGNIAIVELAKKDAHLREIASKYSSSYYYEVSVFPEPGSWRVELTHKTFESRLDKNYHGKLTEDHVDEPGVFSSVKRQAGRLD